MIGGTGNSAGAINQWTDRAAALIGYPTRHARA
jgi:hypothetical protein